MQNCNREGVSRDSYSLAGIFLDVDGRDEGFEESEEIFDAHLTIWDFFLFLV